MSPDVIAVHSPVARTFGDGDDELAPRLATLEHATIGLLWNGKAMGDVALKAIGRLLEARIPGVEVRFYPGSLPCSAELLAQVGAECDAVVACTADCGSCTSWITHDVIQIERVGVPTAIIASAGFEVNIAASARAFGIPGVRCVTVPHVYNNLTEGEAIAQTEPIIDRVIAELVVSAAAAGDQVAAPPRIQSYGAPGDGAIAAFRAFNDDFTTRDWGDGLPLWPPTREAVDALIEGAGLARDEVVCVLPPGNGHATVEAVAANAAMAGCAPAELPVVIAALRAVAAMPPPMNRVVLMSTSAHAPLFVVNGPIARELGINGERCCFGPGAQNEVNIRIARAILFAMKNIGRWYPGTMDLDSVGTARKFGMVIAENEAANPWDPFHVTNGFDRDDDVVTVFFTVGDWDVGFQGHVDADQLARALAVQVNLGTNNGHMTDFMGQAPPSDDTTTTVTGGGRVVVLAPQFAHPLIEAGWSKRRLAEAFCADNEVRGDWTAETARKLHADGKVKPEWEWLFELPREEAARVGVPLLRDPDLYHVIIAGDVRAKGLVFPTWNAPQSVRVDRRATSVHPPIPPAEAP